MNRLLRSLALVLAIMAAGAQARAAAEAQAPRIAFLSDTHLNLRTNDSGLAYNRRLDQAIAEVNFAKVDLVLIAGDLTDGGTREQMELFKRKVKALKAPVLFIPGNHDVGIVGVGEAKTTITPERVRLYGKTLGPNWFVREEAGVRVVGINSCLFGSGFKEEAEQWKFLEKEMAKPQPKPTLLLEHYPLFIKSADEPQRSTWNVPPEPRQRLLALVERAQVRAVLSGHLHYPITNRLDGILFLGNTTTAFGLPRGKQPEGWMLLTVPPEGEIQFEFRKLE
jgi:3',5'-cyclic AMP phosphodiesterase CpdA